MVKIQTDKKPTHDSGKLWLAFLGAKGLLDHDASKFKAQVRNY